MSLLHETYKYISDNKLTKYFLLVNLFNNVFLSIILSDLMIRIADDPSNGLGWLPYLLGIKAISPLINKYIVSPLSNNLINQVSKLFVSDKYHLYTSISYESKVLKPYQVFNHAITPAKNAVCLMIGWGLPNFISLISIICGVVWTFWMKGIIMYLIGLLATFGIFYTFYFQPKQEEFTKKDKDLRKIRHTMQAKLDLNGTSFQYKEVPTSDMIDYEHIIANCGKDIEVYWENIMNDTMIALEYMAIIIIWLTCKDVTTFLLISFTLKQFSNGCQNLMYFMTNFNRFKNDFNTLHDLMKDAIIKEEPILLR